ncbi:MAG: rhomboid family intramembrane serine protease [Tannerellaceae bacterium]|nr:rhomboid family intramembrane serine protease [Tannerellaceae bacterium]
MLQQTRQGFFSSIPPVTKNIIIINVIFWLASITLPKVGPLHINLVNMLGLHFITAPDFNPVQLVSYMFLHDTRSFEHLFFNMFAVYMFGRVLESVWGPKRFLIFYFITGIGAGLIQEAVWAYDLREILAIPGNELIMFNGRVTAVSTALNQFITVGASGAVFGILLAFGMLFPNAPLFILFIPIPVKAKYFVVFYGLIELFMGVSRFSGDSVAHFAHLGGMLFGYIMIRYWKKKDVGNGKYFY